MYVTLIMGFMLLVMLAGYFVLIKAHTQGGKLKTIGQVISWIVIITAFIGTVCSTAAIHFNLKPYCYKKGHIYSKTQCDIYQKQCGQNKKFAIVLQAGKETHEGMARAVHALLYAAELKEKGYEVVLTFPYPLFYTWMPLIFRHNERLPAFKFFFHSKGTGTEITYYFLNSCLFKCVIHGQEFAL